MTTLSPPSGDRCPHDGGACHHQCAKYGIEKRCARFAHGYALTIPWPGFPVAGDKVVELTPPHE